METIASLDDPRVAAYRNLRDRTLRGESVFVAEGYVLARRLLESRFEAESILVDEEYAGEFDRLAAGRMPVYAAPKTLLLGIVGFPFHRGALAVGRRPSPRSLEDILALRPAGPSSDRLRLVVLPEVTKPENLGLAFRAAAAFGIDAVVLGPRSCDPFSRRALRVSMGAVLTVPFVRSADLASDLSSLKCRWGVELTAAVLDEEAPSLSDASWPPRAAVVLGNEFDGLPAEWLSLCDRRLTIPMRPDTDSLNLGVAAGIFLYEMTILGTGRREKLESASD
jgi:tRNA G18 (ribose-2'-O)-methylase SpoU